MTTSDPLCVISNANLSEIVNDTSESIWEEMEILIGKESNMSANALIVMAISGFLAVVGIATNALHIVIAGMVIAPGFEPISRISLGVASKSNAWKRGISNTAAGYGALLAGAIFATMVLNTSGIPPILGKSSYLPAGSLLYYWSNITMSSVAISSAAGIAGALLIATNRSVLTAGVMIALALIPSFSIFGMAIMSGEIILAGQSLLRWSIDVIIVISFSLLVFSWKRFRVHKRRMLL
jgi:uncharacterized membrane protein